MKNITFKRKEFIDSLQLPNNFNELSNEKKLHVIYRKVRHIQKVFQESISGFSSDNYTLSRRQTVTRKNMQNEIKNDELVFAYCELLDFFEDYGDEHNNIFYLAEFLAIVGDVTSLSETLDRKFNSKKSISLDDSSDKLVSSKQCNRCRNLIANTNECLIFGDIPTKILNDTCKCSRIELKSFNKDTSNPNKVLVEAEKYIFSDIPDYTKAKSILFELLKSAQLYNNIGSNEYYNFNNYLEYSIFMKTSKIINNVVWLKLPFFKAYNYLVYIYSEEKNYEEAIRNANKAIRWNPCSLIPYFDKCEIYKKQGNLEKFKILTELIYNKVFESRELAKYYRNLGFYYTKDHKYNLAYALFNASNMFYKTENALMEMDHINNLLSGDNYNISKEETIKVLSDNGIQFGPLRKNVNILMDIFNNDFNYMKNSNNEMFLATNIYLFTKDKKFSPFYRVIDRKVNCSILVPRTWTIVTNKESEQNMFTIYTDTKAFFQAYFDGRCEYAEFENTYNMNIDNICNNGEYRAVLLSEDSYELNTKMGIKVFKQALFEINTNDGARLRMVHVFTMLNGVVVDFTINVSRDVDYRDIEAFNSQKNIKDLRKILSSIVEL